MFSVAVPKTRGKAVVLIEAVFSEPVLQVSLAGVEMKGGTAEETPYMAPGAERSLGGKAAPAWRFHVILDTSLQGSVALTEGATTDPAGNPSRAGAAVIFGDDTSGSAAALVGWGAPGALLAAALALAGAARGI